MTRRIHRLSILSLAVTAALGLSACNDGDPTTSSSPATTSGVITGFGSVFVNGVEYETGAASVEVDGVPADESALKVGMVVTLEGSVNPDGSTGEALSIRFADEVQGEVLANDVANTNTLTIMGQTVHVDADTVFESFDPNQLGPADIQPGNIVEVSGFSSGDGNIYASRIEVMKAARDPGEEMELKGVIANLDSANQTFRIGAQTISYAGANLDGLSAPENGLYVEVKSATGFDANGVLVADEIELEDGGDKKMDVPEGKELEIEGVITALINPTNGLVEINGQPVQLSVDAENQGVDLNNLAAGMKLKVEGEVNAEGVLVAKEMKAKPEGKLEIQAPVEAVDPAAGTLTLLGQTVYVTNTTLKRDESASEVRYFDLGDIAQNDWVEVKVYQEADGRLVALKLERDDDEGKPAQIEGKIDAVEAGSLTLGPLTVDLSALSNPPSLMAGDEVDISLSVGADGGLAAQSVEMDD